MPPKFKFTRDEITNAALNVTRKNGISGLTARALAAELGCSVKPIFGLFKNMEEVGQEVFIASDLLYLEATSDNRITLITCVAGDSSRRWVVQGVEIG